MNAIHRYGQVVFVKKRACNSSFFSSRWEDTTMGLIHKDKDAKNHSIVRQSEGANLIVYPYKKESIDSWGE
jgi:hypothetical protein